jgi:alpha-galactosidase
MSSPIPSSKPGQRAHLSNGGVDFLLEVIDGAPVIRYWAASFKGELSQHLFDRSIANSDFDEITSPGMMREHSRGHLGYPTIKGHRAGLDWSTKFSVKEFKSDKSSFQIQLEDSDAKLTLDISATLDQFGVLKVSQELTNLGDTYFLDELNYWMPLSDCATQSLDFVGRWSNERNPQRRDIAIGRYVRDSHEGRPGHNYTIGMIALEKETNFASGQSWALSLAWSGDSQYCIEKNYEGSASISAGEVLLPGEVILATGESYKAPDLYALYSNSGLDGLASNMHKHLRARSLHPKSARPMTLNLWEAIYFDHNEEKLKKIVDAAAESGFERVVLDDGWFGSRRSDLSGLGDWQVSKEVWPDGLGSIANYIRDKGMEFGLWFEGEMVNPDSELYRAHPDWILKVNNRLGPTWRHQLVLNLDNQDAYNYVLDSVDKILTQYQITYIKWDHNRVLIDAGSDNRAAVRKQTQGLYRLFAELKKRHKNLEIESCASGGARIDLGIIDLVDRFWTSDNNDALERARIQRWSAQFIPPELLGTHIGADPGHQTGRSLSFSFRALTALFGHAGVERDITKLSSSELAELKSWIKLYKQKRELLHSGDVIRIDYPKDSHYLHGVISKDKRSALFSFSCLETIPESHPPRLRIRGLDSDRRYRVEAISGIQNSNFMAIEVPKWLTTGLELTGSELENIGLSAPILRPASALLIEITAL